MSASSEKLLGRVAVAAKMISMDQLSEATREQARMANPAPLGEVLISLGFMTKAQLAKAIELQKGVVERMKQQKAAAQPAQPAAEAAKEAPPAAAPAKISRTVEKVAPEGAAEAGLAGAEMMHEVELAPDTDDQAADGLAADAVEQHHSAAVAAPVAGPSIRGDEDIEGLLRQCAELGASDLHLHSRAKLRMRINGQLRELGDTDMDPGICERMALSLMSSDEREIFSEHGEVDFSYSLPGVGRFRCNVYRQLRGVDASLRRISLEPPTLDDLGLPSDLARLTNFHQGMVLLTGPTRCGKSSTMAALVNLVNEERAEHILTIEDPIEYLHRSKRCLVNQRNVGRHTETFARALRAALREDPDVIVIGELRDAETVSLAMTAAETGHFVLATLHTDNAVRTVNRIIGSFPPDQQDQVRAMLSESLRAVISQRLVAKADDSGQIAALEVMVVNRAVGNLIREAKTVQLRSLLQTGKKQGMCLLDTSLAELVTQGVITREEALRHVEDPKLIPGR